MNTIPEDTAEDATHSFVVPAYKQSPYLESCLASLAEQTRRSPIVISTSTPFAGLDDLARKYGARVHVHGPNRGIAHDWSVAVASAGSPWVTIAHQDDVYLPHFAERTVRALERSPAAALAFTGYAEVAGSAVRKRSTMLWIKVLLLELAFWGRCEVKSRWSKTNALRFGCPIPCPAVTLRRDIADGIFDPSYTVNLDWSARLKLARERTAGGFVYIRETLMLHRIHADSATTEGISGGARASEDERIFRQLWPAGMARLIANFYRMAYKGNSL